MTNGRAGPATGQSPERKRRVDQSPERKREGFAEAVVREWSGARLIPQPATPLALL